MAVTFQNGPDPITCSRMLVNGSRVNIAGQRVRTVFSDEHLSSFLNLTGNESVQVQSEGRPGFRNETQDYIMRDGDTVSFSKAAGEKGV